MRILTLVRHAKSSWDAPGLTDFERPLNTRGRRDAPAMAARLAGLGVRPDRLLSSPALRAITTARLFAPALGIAPESITLDSRIYDATAETLLAVVQEQPAEVRELMLFGHNPGLSALAASLIGEPFNEMPTCAAARIGFDVKSWHQVRPEAGKMLLLEYPKKKS
jgi:phosphohistidine phosphatase